MANTFSFNGQISSGFTPWNPGYAGAGTFANFHPAVAAEIQPPQPTPPTATGQEPAAYEANPYGKVRPKHIAGSLWMGGRIVEGPFFGGTATDPTLSAIYYVAERANPNSSLAITKLAIRGKETPFDGSGNLTDPQFAGAVVEFKTGQQSQTPCAQSVARYGANAIGYTRGILISIKDLPLRPLAGIVPLLSCYIEDSSFGDPADEVAYDDLLGVVLKDARYRTSEFEVDVQRTYPAMILANSWGLIDFLQNERKILVHLNIGFTDKLRIVEPTTFDINAEITNANLVRDTLTITDSDRSQAVRKIQSTYIDKDRDYQDNIATAQEDVLPFPATTAIQTENVSRPVVSTASQEASDAHIALYERLAVLTQMKGALLSSQFGLEVGDGVRYADHDFIDFTGRAMEVQHDFGKINVTFSAGEVLNCGPVGTAGIVFLDFHEASGTNDEYNLGSCDLGEEDPSRVIVAIPRNTKSVSPRRAVTGLTIGGNPANAFGNIEEGATVVNPAPSMGIALFTLAVPTGTSAVVTVSMENNVDGCGVALFALYGANATPHDVKTDRDPTGGNPAVSLSVPAGGTAIAGYAAMGGTLGSASWVGLSEVDENESFPGPSAWASGAHQSAMPAGTLPIQASSSATGPEVLIAASFEPL